ncbi:MAG: acyltransferase [Pseudomonadota bacterium]
MEWKHLTKEDTALYKGIGILLIVGHNFFHWVAPSTGENEFVFDAGLVKKLASLLVQQPLESINLALSYFGHYGVGIFIFLSGYGLARSRAGGNGSGAGTVGWFSFMNSRVRRIYPGFALAVVLYIVFEYFRTSALPPPDTLKELVLKLSLLASFFPDQALSVNGPWWFYSFIFQCYAVFPLLAHVHRRLGPAGLWAAAAAGLIFIAVFNPMLTGHGVNALQMAAGHLPEFCLGIYLAGRREQKLNGAWLLVAAAIFVLGNLFRPAWHLSFLSCLVLVLAGLQVIVPMIRRRPALGAVIAYYGIISMYLFACHGFLRGPFVYIANKHTSPVITLMLGAAFLLAATAVAQLMMAAGKIRRQRFF